MKTKRFVRIEYSYFQEKDLIQTYNEYQYEGRLNEDEAKSKIIATMNRNGKYDISKEQIRINKIATV